MPSFRLKACISLFDIHTDSPIQAKKMAGIGVGLQPNMACELKRAGFLEGGWTTMRTSQMLKTVSDLARMRLWWFADASRHSADSRSSRPV
ncbi:MAG: hypothetical protein KJ798_10175 [Gammaproteobacteria bacterium]|nr:hypothetical protein [Gammaproteobacteria bacterium]MBU0850292.1 hypothetical protein [Gammaproteobacteria bacterium]MBU1267839.1 hypothetical protein [Gammaproteobacteria bacterium]MBU1528416.1 hypothetical protein [Gammaproteobacteria bacterium]MBU1780737.1 hypothetical protein [Gammaproteobacteria bacterium]